jgi:hypothetical protein
MRVWSTVNTLQTGVLYAAEMKLGDKARPVRILDTRRWTSASSPKLGSFQWRLDVPDEWRHYSKTVGMACLYWSHTGDVEPNPQALLDFPWEPLPEDREAAGEELTRIADATGGHRKAEAHGSWLCLRPVARDQIVGPWEEYDYEQMLSERTRAHGQRLLEWDSVNRRLATLGLETVRSDLSGVTAPITLEQIAALLDRAEQPSATAQRGYSAS